MGILGKLFGKRDETGYPKYAGEIEKVLKEPSTDCAHDWHEVTPYEWDEERYGISFELVTVDTNPTTFRDAYYCRNCAGEFVTIAKKDYR